MRPMLRPGLQILRRDVYTIQLGLEWPGVGAIGDSAALRAVLSAIDGYRDAYGVVQAVTAAGVPAAEAEVALATLVETGAVVDQGCGRAPGVPEATWSAWSLLAGPGRDASDVARDRTACRVHVIGQGQVADRVSRLLEAARVSVTRPSRADVLVVTSDREPERRVSDAVMHSSQPHLWVYVRDLVGVVGPFVLPGETACLRCVDSARRERDPAWPTLLDSAATRPAYAAACDEVLATLVAAWATHEIALWASRIRPHTWGRVVEVPPGVGNPDDEAFAPHPGCGCGWPSRHDTMGA